MSKGPLTQEKLLKSYRFIGRCVLALLLPLILTGLWLFTAGPEYRDWARIAFRKCLECWVFLLLIWIYFRIHGLRYFGTDVRTYRAKQARFNGWLAFISFAFTFAFMILPLFSVGWWPQFEDDLDSLEHFTGIMATLFFAYWLLYKFIDLDAFQTDNKGQDQRMVEKP